MMSGDSRHTRVFRLLAYVAVLAVVTGIAWCIVYARWRSDAIAKMRKSHGSIKFSPLPAFVPKWLPAPEWLRWIESVELYTNDTNDDDLRCFAGFPLTKIQPAVIWSPCSSPRLSDAGLRHLAGAPLKSLELQYSGVSGEGFVHLRGCSTLRMVRVVPNDAGLAALAGVRTLEDVGVYGTKFTDAGIAELKRLPNLKRLDVLRSNVTDEGLKELAGIRTLEDIGLHGARITDAGLAELKTLPALKHLELSWNDITDEGLAQLAELKLESLSLDCTYVTDAGLRHLTKMPLRKLSIGQTSVTPAGLHVLIGMKTLELVVVLHSNFIGKIDDLRADGLKVRYGSGGQTQATFCERVSW